MDITGLKRDPARIHQTLRTLRNGAIITEKDCSLTFPVKYQEQGLAKIAAETYILGIFAIIIEGRYYGVSRAPTMLHMGESEINTVKVDGQDYYEFNYSAGDKVILSNESIKDDQVLYNVYNEFISKGNIPWFFSYEDVGKLFELSGYHAGLQLGANHAIPELVAATIARNPKNPNQYYRHYVESQAQVEKEPPEIIKLNSVTYGATNTTAKLIGGYWDEGVTSALVNPSDRVEPIEEILRR